MGMGEAIQPYPYDAELMARMQVARDIPDRIGSTWERTTVPVPRPTQGHPRMALPRLSTAWVTAQANGYASPPPNQSSLACATTPAQRQVNPITDPAKVVGSVQRSQWVSEDRLRTNDSFELEPREEVCRRAMAQGRAPSMSDLQTLMG